MQAFILAAGLGTRLKPWTLHHPKALVPVGGVPMLERVILRLREEGFSRIIINVHHFASQIVDFINAHDFGVEIIISDESERLLDTGGALAHTSKILPEGEGPVLVHNVDILSDAPLANIMKIHIDSSQDVSLVTSNRSSSRRLVFDADDTLRGWHNLASGEYRPAGFYPHSDMHESAFSGIYVLDPGVISDLAKFAALQPHGSFPIMDYFIKNPYHNNMVEIKLDNLNLIDIGKPETLGQAQSLFQ